jgi:hypothetical protein
MGVRTAGIVQASVIPLVLTMILFAGPLAMSYYDEWLFHFQRGTIGQYLLDQLKAEVTSLIFWRNYIVGPLTEEWVFRSCMCPLLICGGFSWTQTIFLSPFFFGIGTDILAFTTQPIRGPSIVCFNGVLWRRCSAHAPHHPASAQAGDGAQGRLGRSPYVHASA